jgi:hypothetical protein
MRAGARGARPRPEQECRTPYPGWALDVARHERVRPRSPAIEGSGPAPSEPLRSTGSMSPRPCRRPALT